MFDPTTNAQIIASTVFMLRSSYPSKMVLLVEGQHDCIFFKEIVHEEKSQVPYATYGKNKLVDAIDVLNQEGQINGYLGICDPDYDILENKRPIPNVLYVDDHDFDVTRYRSKALDKVIENALLGAMNEPDILMYTQSVREKLFRSGCILGYVRWKGRDRWWHKKFVEDILPIVVQDGIELDKIIAWFKSKSIPMVESDLIGLEFETLYSNDAKYYICQGHDLSKILEIVMREIREKYYNNTAKHQFSDAEERLRIAYEKSMFKETRLYRLILDWENSNSPHEVIDEQFKK